MIEMTRQEMIERIILFQETKVYTYIKDKFGYMYNGFIMDLNQIQTIIIFKDDKIPHPIPIRVEDIKDIAYSKREKIQKEEEK